MTHGINYVQTMAWEW
ncbi:MAG: CRISPR-associated DxTHG motif protein [Lunatimonas sp.]|nr:CRISPR-associated DxTHG motif protein [Lunatimonas sp.]